ncbi:MAG: hypothetical protein JW749_09630 [Sedimentisphaerales bacterium]|nr:hypothetical protein [Sedimentisphaerales bacterium]
MQAVKANVESKFSAFAIIIACIAAVLYLPVLRADFVYDDLQQIVADDADPYAGLAITYDGMGMTAAAEETFRKAISFDRRYTNYDTLTQSLL